MRQLTAFQACPILRYRTRMAARVCTGSASLAFPICIEKWHARTPHSGSKPHDLSLRARARGFLFECLGKPRRRFQTCTLRFGDSIRVYLCSKGAPEDRRILERKPKDGDCIGCPDDRPRKRGLLGIRLRTAISIFGCSILDEQPGFHL